MSSIIIRGESMDSDSSPSAGNTAVVLAGGKGARLRPLTFSIPKPLLPLGEIPIIELVVGQLAAHGFRRVIIALGHMAHLFMATLGDGSRWGVRLDYFCEEAPLGTAGSLRLIPDLNEDFLVMNGDLLTTVNYRDLYDGHRDRGAWATVSLHRREVKIDYGVVELDRNGDFLRYVEKPTIPYAVSMGINVLSKKALEYIPSSVKFDLPDLIMALHREGKPVTCIEPECYWQDIGRLDDYQQANADFERAPEMFLSPGMRGK